MARSSQERISNKQFLVVEPELKTMRVVFRGSTHGFTKDAFRSHVLEPPLGPIVILVKCENNRIFSMHTGSSISRTRPGHWIHDPSAKLLGVTDRTDHPVYNNPGNAIMHSTKDFIIQFGIEDMCLAENCNENYKSCSRLGWVYRPPEGCVKGDKECETHLAGSFHFKVSDIEIFECIYE